ncbi:AMP-binding protein [Microbacterium telephonicum]|uniref:O-succinylbenzoic acid--CoA ligase n=1 Tax=Microbacterium telephonicum TaxID=1714841 RepID=A0A498CEP9_9MICO|nr:AMP-binding protein [Microbacterium telephonicum]RLK52836.1 O-succinylbenzoic acid--CoA ligase [Microbacterium telephonicum]
MHAADVLRGLRAVIDGAGAPLFLGDAGGAVGGDAGRLPAPPGTAVVVTTSGSSGYPKSVVLSRSALIASTTATAERLGEGRWLLALPATYIAGVQVLVRSLMAGHEPALLSGSFSAEAFAALAATMHSRVGDVDVPVYTSLVPAQLQTLLDAADAGIRTHLDTFAAVLVGGQALAPALAERAAASGVRIVRTYGSSETAGGCVYDGVPLRGATLRIVDGEVQVSGPMLADGYLGEPERTADVFIRDDDGTRWYRTGDAGTLDGGVLRVTGRRDNVIVSGGVNVSLDRVEQAVRTLAGLETAVVVPVTDERWGQGSVVVLDEAARRGDPDVLERIRAAVGAQLGAPARPRGILAVDEVPLLPSGKPDRAALARRVADA